jgi:alkanesulfonate monooxygenase SsuD/methylene tetrahydromethanopterin reductase-like flavin-dependent oxidoreductase (luciferase family)
MSTGVARRVTATEPRPGPAAPLSSGSVSLGLSAVGETAQQIVGRLVADASLAVEGGFDGVTLSEHHAGFPGYVPSPLALADVLRERMPRGWACAAPAILPLRNPVLLAEELAWSEAVHPGRVGAAFVPGYQESDFMLVGADFEARHRAHWSHLRRLVDGLGGRHPDAGGLADDPAVRGLPPGGLPILTGAAGPIAARRAAELGVGMLIPSLRPASEVRDLIDLYASQGGVGPTVLIRRVHVGGRSTGSDVNVERWRSRSGSAQWLDLSDEALATGEPEAVLDTLVGQVRRSGCSALNLRLECYADAPTHVSSQIASLAEHVLPQLRAQLGWPDEGGGGGSARSATSPVPAS